MVECSKVAYIGTNTVGFAQNVIQALNDMAGMSFNLDTTSFKERPFVSRFNMFASVHFMGTLQGDYIISMDEITALKLIDTYQEGMSHEQIRQSREEHGGFIKELLNLAVGESILELENTFGDLTFNPCTVIYGEIDLPEIKSGQIMLTSEAMEIQCGFSLNFAVVKIGRRLEETLQELERKNIEAKKNHKVVDNILRMIPSALVAVDPDGIILPGHSRTVRSLTGYTGENPVAGLTLPTLLDLHSGQSKIINSFFQIFDQNQPLLIDDLIMMCEGELHSKNGKIFKLRWLPVIDDQNMTLEKLLILIENIT